MALLTWSLRKGVMELKHQAFLVTRTPTGSIFAAWQPLRMSRRSWAAVTVFKTRVLRLKPEAHAQILGSLKSIRHTKVEILHLKSCFIVTKQKNVTQIFERHFNWIILFPFVMFSRCFAQWFAFCTQTASPMEFCAASHAVRKSRTSGA